MIKSRLAKIISIMILLFFYLPIVLLIVNSFNASRFSSSWQGFSLKWYQLLFRNDAVWNAFQNTLVIAVSATLVSIVLGTLSAFALHRYKTRLQKWHYTLIYTPLVVPDILMGMSLLLFFIAVGLDLGLLTIFLAHVTFCISYVAFVVLARLQDFDFTLLDAARDLGATSWQAVWKVLVPLLLPGILSGGLLAFTLSIDDFVISFFVAGAGSTTLPIRIYSMIKHGQPALINALSTLLLIVTFVLVYTSQKLTEEKS